MIVEKKKYLVTPILGFGISLGFEITQFFNTIGGFAYIDLITNTLGTVFGMVLVHLLLKVIKPSLASKILIAFSVIFGIIAVYATINTLIHIDIYL